MNRVSDIIGSNKNIDGWKIVRVHSDSYQLFCIHGKIETVRRASSVNYTATVYVNHDGKTGSGTFTVNVSDSAEEIAAKTDKAAASARLIFDEPYALPYKQQLMAMVPCDYVGVEIAELANMVYEAVLRGCKAAHCDVNALEIFLDSAKTQIVNSRGLEKCQKSRYIMLEAIPTCTYGGESVELYKTISLANADMERITCEIRSSLADAAARLKAVRPAEKIECPVVFRADEIKELVSALVADSDFSAVYSGNNLHKIGEKWNSGGVCPLTVTLKGLIPDCAGGGFFDSDGVAYKDVVVIEKGAVAAYHGANRFASYLNRRPTGADPSMEISAGSENVSAVLSGKHLEIVSMSGLQIDIYNDYIGGEIRLAYYNDGEKKVPVTGISISGSLSEVLGTLKLSKKRVTLKKYYGPCYARAEKLTVY